MIRAERRPRLLSVEITWQRIGEHAGELTAAGTAALTSVVGLANGGYFSTTWGWIVLVLAWAACLALVLRDRVALGRLELAAFAGLALFVGWVAASILWSKDRSQSVAEVERDLVYVVGVLAALLVVRRSSAPQLLAGLLGGISVVDAYGLMTRLFPNGSAATSLELNQLSRPIGYANGLGIFSVLGVLLALGFVARSRHPWARATAGAALPVLVTTLYFTFSRGGWVALFGGAIAAVVVDPRRLQLLTVGSAVVPWSAAAVWLSSREDGLTSLTGSYAEIRAEGRHLFVILLLLAIGSAASALLVARAERRIVLGPAARRAYAIALAAVAAIGLAAALARYGDPVDLTRRAYDSFRTPPSKAPPEQQLGNDLNQRLFTLTGTYRFQQWRAAWDDYRSSPWLGSGAGSFERYWLQHRTVHLSVRDAHSLYLEAVAELGWLGLALLGVALAAPLVAAVRARAGPLVPAASGAYAAYVLHAGIDWDWELPAVTLSGLLCGVALLTFARNGPRRRLLVLSPPLRAATAAAMVVVAALSVIGVVGNRALAAATAAVNRGDWGTASTQARAAIRWMPWSGPAWQQLGDAQLGLGDREAARKSLLKAARKGPHDWSIWFDLGTASRGAEQRAAYREARRLNPLHPNVRLLRAGSS